MMLSSLEYEALSQIIQQEKNKRMTAYMRRETLSVCTLDPAAHVCIHCGRQYMNINECSLDCTHNMYMHINIL